MKTSIPSVAALFALVTPHWLGASRVEAAFPSSVTALIDESADPCDDFYQYTCGKWIDNFTLPENRGRYDLAFDTVNDRNALVIQDILKEDLPLVGELWNSCMDKDTLNALGNKPLQGVLERIRAVSSKEELFVLAGQLGHTQLDFFAGLSVYADEKNATLNTLHMRAGVITLPDASYYFGDTFKDFEQPFRKYISSVMSLSGYLDTGVNTSNVEDTVIAMQSLMANASLVSNAASENDPDPSYHPITYAEAAAAYPLGFGLFAKGLELLENSTLTEDSTIIFTSLRYFESIEAALGDLELEDLKTFLAYSYVTYLVIYLGDDFYQVYFDFFLNTLTGQTVQSSRESVCTDQETFNYPDLIGRYYFLKMLNTESEANANEMLDLIKDAMEQHIEKLDWLDEPTRRAAEAKLTQVTQLIGHSTQNRTYPYTLDNADYFGNIDKIANDWFNRDLKKINHPVDKTEWSTGAATVNAYYFAGTNTMTFPAGILQPPFYNDSRHPAQNFGSIGATMGHELTHGFDSNGRLYDGEGNKKNWWSEETSQEFNKRAQCLARQYSNFTVTGLTGANLGHVDGNLTVRENTADNGGLRLAFDAYHNYMANASLAEVPAGTELPSDESDKLFYVAFAQTWCSKWSDAAMKNLIATNAHSPPKWRVNGVTMNNADFARTFQCKATDRMNPETKCVIW